MTSENGQKKTQYQIRIEKELKDKFLEINERKSINSSELIRKWIKEYIDKEENNKKI